MATGHWLVFYNYNYTFLFKKLNLLSVFQKRQFIKAPKDSAQIHHDGQLHWVCSSINSNGDVTLFDSMTNGRTSRELDTQLALLYRQELNDLSATIAPVQQQRGGSDCGLFAIAFCLAFAFNQDPTTLRYRQCKMRKHLSEIFRT